MQIKKPQVDFDELMEFIQRTGICMLDTFQGYSRQEISGFSSFVERVQNTILLNLKRVHANHGDYQRTVGINTGHIETVDFDNMVYADKKFIEERGYNGTKAFLQYHVIIKDMIPDVEIRRDSKPEVGNHMTGC
ncbi:hypothetical protein LOTGIDRAFT_176196 [Lottia gigantea]|uniref:Uncharacterized protein n=1 Tax=Lottia gigantea TaxID=225164 RepID=V4B5F4_LOTGI|nr:hypothetical protein LOTGIDRAFT_176196 [Lottia gigantea]ESO83704.1 hypothetical protein LOTGIDRAFT_176196 [Lottia gigantea]